MADTNIRLDGANGRQIAIVAGGALLAAMALFALWYLVIRTSYAPAFTDLKTPDASLIVEELKRQKTPYELTDGGTTIMVPEDQVDASRISILGGDLPLKGTVGFELFNQSDMGLTEFAQKINYQRALQGELARTLMSLENIETARVHLSLPDSGIFERDKRPAKASVTIAAKIGKVVDGTTVTGIQRLIASAVPELDTGNVSVLDAQGQLLNQDVLAADISAVTPSGSPIEQEYALRVRDAIAPIISDPALRVTVRIAKDLVSKSQPKSGDGATGVEDVAGASAASDAGTERVFPIRISIILSSAPDSQMRDMLIPFLVDSVAYSPARGDSFMLLTAPASLPPLSTRSNQTVPIGPNDDERSNSVSNATSSIWMWVLLAAGVMAMLYLLIRYLKTQREMTPTQREAFADRLKTLIDEQGAHNSGAV